jgi:hypothetical protein
MQKAPVNLKTVFVLHKQYFSVLRYAKGFKKVLAVSFLALLAFDFIYAFTEPAHALIFDDLTEVGRGVGESIMEGAFGVMTQLYNGDFGVLPWLCKTCLYFAAPVAAAGIVQYLSEDAPPNPISRPAILGSIFLVIMLSGGGFIFGQTYLFIVHIFEGFFKQMDDYLNYHEAIAEGKAYLASNSMISASVAECGKLLGQEQQRCISQAAESALATLGDFKETFGVQSWIENRIDAFEQILDQVISPNTSLSAKASNLFFMFSAPAAEAAAASQAAAFITAMSAVYACTITFIGLGGPIAGLSSLLVPGLRSGWIAWLTGIFAVWFWRIGYICILWFLSKILVNAKASEFLGTAWFSFAGTWVAPILAAGVAGAGGFAVWTGLSNSLGGTVATVAGVASAGILRISQQSPPAPTQNNSAPQNSSAPPVRTDY